jgi:hypothetical protein
MRVTAAERGDTERVTVMKRSVRERESENDGECDCDRENDINVKKRFTVVKRAVTERATLKGRVAMYSVTL